MFECQRRAELQVTPDPRSRFYDPTNPDCPQLPVPRPVLNSYALPELVTGNPAQTQQHATPSEATSQTETAKPETEQLETKTPQPDSEQSPSDSDSKPPARPESSNDQDANSTSAVSAAAPVFINPELSSALPPHPSVTPASFNTPNPITQNPTQSPATTNVQADQASVVQAAQPTDVPNAQDNQPDDRSDSEEVAKPAAEKQEELPPPRSDGAIANKVTIPKPAWEVLPQNCLARMLEFNSLRSEYELTFGENDQLHQNDNVRRLTLANLMELATINSREYQTRKEILFTTALALTRRRYQYELNPTPFGNGTAANYQHLRTNGIEQNRLAIPTGVGVQKTLATGGEFLARFANSVVLTFNGPTGFASDISSDLVFDFQQTIFQRDIRFETLTQSERDVIYATRDYLRFRKQLFRDVANSYYNLLLSYRGIEINAQDYFHEPSRLHSKPSRVSHG